jgi:hypothetical protein
VVLLSRKNVLIQPSTRCLSWVITTDPARAAYHLMSALLRKPAALFSHTAPWMSLAPSITGPLYLKLLFLRLRKKL